MEVEQVTKLLQPVSIVRSPRRENARWLWTPVQDHVAHRWEDPFYERGPGGSKKKGGLDPAWQEGGLKLCVPCVPGEKWGFRQVF